MSPFWARSTGLDALIHRPRPSPWERFRRQPCVFLARWLSSKRKSIPFNPIVDLVSIVCISDTHNSQPDLPDGDVLIHAGDLTQSGTFEELQAALDWLIKQPHAVKVVIAGIHDLLLDPGFSCKGSSSLSSRSRPDQKTAGELCQSLAWGDLVYLEDSEHTVTCPNGRRLRVYGSPHSPRHGNWAFQYPRTKDIWAGRIPQGIDVLVTHGPPRGHLDLLNLGCVHLLRQLWETRPRLHVFGHVHEGAGREWLHYDPLQAAYERTIVSGGGIWNLMCTVWAYLQVTAYSRTERAANSILVNASMVGGLRDDERRRPVKVWI